MSATQIVTALLVHQDNLVAARIDLTPAKAERLLMYRGVIAGCREIDEERFHGVEYDDSDIEFGDVVGADLEGMTANRDMDDPVWGRLPDTPAPDAKAVPEFIAEPADGYDNPVVVVTVDGPYWSAEVSMVGVVIDTSVLPWSVIELAAKGVVDVPTAPYDVVKDDMNDTEWDDSDDSDDSDDVTTAAT